MNVTITKAEGMGYGSETSLVTLHVSLLPCFGTFVAWFLPLLFRVRRERVVESMAEKFVVHGYGHSWQRHDGKPLDNATSRAITSAWKAWASAHAVTML